jgi:hypothetical protein
MAASLESSDCWVQLSSVRESERNDVSIEAEESALLRSVIRKRPLKAKREDIIFAKVICKLCEIAIALSFRVFKTCKLSIKPIIQNPVYSLDNTG